MTIGCICPECSGVRAGFGQSGWIKDCQRFWSHCTERTRMGGWICKPFSTRLMTGRGTTWSFNTIRRRRRPPCRQSRPSGLICFFGKRDAVDRWQADGAMMNLGLINSAFAQAGKGTRFGLEQTKAIGFDTVDIFADPLDIDVKERRLIKDTCDELALPIRSIA